jgi:hypothetical protein
MVRFGPPTSGRLNGSNLEPLVVQIPTSRPEVGGPKHSTAFLFRKLLLL